jgi:putative endonuclease
MLQDWARRSVAAVFYPVRNVEQDCMQWLQSWFAIWWRKAWPWRLGSRGEQVAERYVRSLGWRVVARSARSRYGELDLVAVDGRTVVFIEVKTRSSHEAGHPAEAVEENKQRRLTRAARAFVQQHRLHECATRFDVIALTWPHGARQPQLEHIRRAFEARD